jgi:adenylate kinase
LKLILFGPPGAGKGTQCKEIVKKFDFFQLATGDMIRAEIAAGSEIGKKVQQIVEAGKFPSSDLVNEMVVKTIVDHWSDKGIVFDGYPRTFGQGEFLDRFLAKRGSQIDCAIMLEVNEKDLIDRIEKRYSCLDCGQMYAQGVSDPKVDGVCDKCGSKQFGKRADDNADVMRTRLKTYHAETEEIINYYDNKGLLIRINGTDSIENVRLQIEKIVEAKQTELNEVC